MRIRSHKYPDLSHETYTDTTYYDQSDQSLDVGYQRLKLFDLNHYRNLVTDTTNITKLLIDHNNLKTLPHASLLPHLQELNCAANLLTTIPFYAKLTALNVSHNMLTNLASYYLSELASIDCSYNPNIILHGIFPQCSSLYLTNNNLTKLNLIFFPKIVYLDCSHNNLSQIDNSQRVALIELNIQHNQIVELETLPHLTILLADYNSIQVVPTYNKLVRLSIPHNAVRTICTQPCLRILIADHNQINLVGKMSQLKTVDLSHNCLTHFAVEPLIQYLYLHFNPMAQLDINTGQICELKINFNTYRYVYEHHQPYFDTVMTVVDGPKLSTILEKLAQVFGRKLIGFVFKYFNKINTQNRDRILFLITRKIYRQYFAHRPATEMVDTVEFNYLLTNLIKLYHKTLIVTVNRDLTHRQQKH